MSVCPQGLYITHEGTPERCLILTKNPSCHLIAPRLSSQPSSITALRYHGTQPLACKPDICRISLDPD